MNELTRIKKARKAWQTKLFMALKEFLYTDSLTGQILRFDLNPGLSVRIR